MDDRIKKIKEDLYQKLIEKYKNCQINESISKWMTKKETIYYITFNIMKNENEIINLWYEITFDSNKKYIRIKSNRIL